MGIPNRPIRIFLCYAREDEPLLRDLEKQLRLLQRQGFIEVWHDREISPGANWEQEIGKYLNTADIILLLVSPDFINSDYCYGVEMQRAMERHQAGEVRIIPVILRPVSWQSAPFGKIQALPTDAKPVTGSGWQSQEEAFYDVAESIRKVVEKLMMETINSPSIRADENEITNAQTSIGKSILGSGTANDHTLVSSLVPENLTERNTPRPFVSSSDYSGGNVASVPFFPNSHTKQEDVGLPSDRPRTTRLPRVISPLALRLSIVLIVLLALIGGGGRLYYTGYYLPAQQHAFATATARSVGTVTARNNAILAAGLVANNPYPPYTGTLQLKDTLQQNTDNQEWITGTFPNFGSCLFIEGAYHVAIVQSGQFNYCSYRALTFSDFAYQVQVTILKGDWGGLSFRSPDSGSLYYFQIDTLGYYELDVNKNHNFLGTLVKGNSPLIKAGYHQTNLLGVVARGNSFDLYVNLQHVAHGSDTTFNSGLVGVIANYGANSTEVMFQDAEVWKL